MRTRCFEEIPPREKDFRVSQLFEYLSATDILFILIYQYDIPCHAHDSYMSTP